MKTSTRTGLRIGLLAFLCAAVAAVVLRDQFHPVGPGQPAPEIALPALSTGETVRLSDLRGKVVLVNLWAQDCPPCITEIPSMQRLYEMMEGRDFEILAVNQDGAPQWRANKPMPAIPGDTADAAAAAADPFAAPRSRVEHWVTSWLERLGVGFPVLMDWEGDAWDAYEVTGLPESFLIGRDGMIYRKVFQAEWDTPDNVALIERLLAEG